MITYSKTTWGLHLLVRVYGSAFPRSLIFSCVSVAITVALYVTKQTQILRDWRHPYPYQIFAVVVGFIVVFRSQLSYGRYWEGRQQLQTMTARWADFCTQALMMDAGTLPSDINPHHPAWSRACWFADTVVHLTSLLHGLALQHLRNDWDLANLTTFHSIDPQPPTDAAGLPPNMHTLYKYSIADTFQLRGTTERLERYNRAMPIPVVGSVSEPEAVGLGKLFEVHARKQTGTLVNGSDAAPDIDEVTYCGQLKGYFITRAGRALASLGKKAPVMLVLMLVLLGPLQNPLTYMSQRIHLEGLCKVHMCMPPGKLVPGASERVNIAYAWVQQVLQERLKDNGLTLAAPVGSRMWQMLSEGYTQFEQCRAISDTPFPFPWAQMVLVMLLLYAVSVPLVVVAFVDSMWMGIVVNFICVQSYWCLNEVARDLEDPFVYDPNDLPLSRYQYQFNNRILAAAVARRPATAYELSHAEECAASSKGVPVLYQAAS